MQIHRRVAHPKDDSHRCKVCGEECGWPSVLKRHMRKHDESLRLPCDQCGKRFISRQAFIIVDYLD